MKIDSVTQKALILFLNYSSEKFLNEDWLCSSEIFDFVPQLLVSNRHFKRWRLIFCSSKNLQISFLKWWEERFLRSKPNDWFFLKMKFVLDKSLRVFPISSYCSEVHTFSLFRSWFNITWSVISYCRSRTHNSINFVHHLIFLLNNEDWCSFSFGIRLGMYLCNSAQNNMLTLTINSSYYWSRMKPPLV